MTDKELMKLHGLKGTLQGLRTVAQCRVKAAHDCMIGAQDYEAARVHRLSMWAHVSGLRAIRRAERALGLIIKEAEND